MGERFYDERVAFQCPSTGNTGNLAIGSRIGPSFIVPSETAITDGKSPLLLVQQGDDFMIVDSTYNAAGPDFSVDTVRKSKIGGAVGTTRMNLAGAAEIRFAPPDSDDLEKLFVRADIEAGKNVLMNGGMEVDQRNRGAAQTIVAGAALAYTVDRWYAYCTGANVTGQQVSPSSGPARKGYKFTGAASVTAIGFAQRISARRCHQLNGRTATLSVDLANSLLTTVTWTAYYANSEDSFGTLASPTRTQIATGSFTVSGTLKRYSTQIAIPTAAKTGIEIVFAVGAQTSGDWEIQDVQLKLGAAATAFERVPYEEEEDRCSAYFERILDSTVNASAPVATGQAIDNANVIAVLHYRRKRTTAPTLSISSFGDFVIANAAGSFAAVSNWVFTSKSDVAAHVTVTRTGTGLAAGNAAFVRGSSGVGRIDVDAEL